MAVPPEIISHIFSYLQSDPIILEICSRAHPILSRIAEPFRYADIVVLDNMSDMDDKDGRTYFAAKLHTLLTEHPHIANYVRRLEIRVSLNKSIDGAGVGFAPILPMLMQLDRISLTSEIEDSHPIIENLSAEFREAFKNRLLSPTSALNEVAIFSNSNFPLRIFDDCTTVKSILLCGSPNYNDLVVPSNPPILDSLALHDWICIDPLFLAWARERIQSLRSLSLHLRNPIIVHKLCPELFGMCSSSLTNLRLHIFSRFRVRSDADGCYPEEATSGIQVDLSSLPHLKHLTIRANKFISDKGSDCPFPAIVRVLHSTLYLDSLTLKVCICYYGYKKIHFNTVDWSPLLSLLSSCRSRHIGLRLSLNIGYSRHVEASADTLPRLYRSEIVADMMAKGILDIRSENYSVHGFE